LVLAPLHTRRLHIAPGPTGKTHETPTMYLHAQAALAIGAMEGAECPQHVAAFADDGTAGRKVGFAQRQVFMGRVTGQTHSLASSRMVPRSGRKINPTLPVSPWRFFATVSSTARAGGVARRSCCGPLSICDSNLRTTLPI